MARRTTLLAAVAGALAVVAGAPGAAAHPPDHAEPGSEPVRLGPRALEPPLVPTPRASCRAGDRPETGLQGRVSPDDHSSGRAAEGFTCNTRLIGAYTKPTTPLEVVPGFENAHGTVGGLKVLRYVDEAGRECAYYDTTLLFPTNIFDALVGVNVLDMSDPSDPVLTDRLVTPAMLSPHESLTLSSERGLLAAVTGNAAFYPGIVDIYDISEDCRHPVLRSSTPTGVLGHESGMAPDGMTFYTGSAGGGTLTALDISNPALPVPLTVTGVASHGLSISDDGNRAYVASVGGEGLVIYDSSEVQARAANPRLRKISSLQWGSMSIPQKPFPVTIDGRAYVVEIDEFGTLREVGAARIIDISDETAPRVVSNLRLEVHQPENFDRIRGDRGAQNPVGGYSGHYCNVPRRTDPGIVACTMSLSGLRVFDIRDPENPRELGYFNAPVTPRVGPGGGPADVPPEASNWALSSPAFAPERGEIWYSDGYTGFYAVRMAPGTWPFSAEDGEGGGDGGDSGEGPGTAIQVDAGNGGGGEFRPGGADGGTAGQAEGPGTAGGEPAEATTGADGGSLPFTGLALAGLLACGLALLLVGALVRLARQRAVRPAAPRRNT